jgi:hypothetical protein
MEAPVAEYYAGRKVLAHYDLLEPVLEPLTEAMREHVDVLVVDAAHQELAHALPGFERVCTLRRNTQPVRFLYARPTWHLPYRDEDVDAANARYDATYRPRRVPRALPVATHFLDKLAMYQRAIRDLRATRFAHRAP